MRLYARPFRSYGATLDPERWRHRKDGAPSDASPWWATNESVKGVQIMRKTSLIFVGAVVGVVATLLLTQPHTLLTGSAARAAASDTYRTLNLFGDVFEVVRAAYVEKRMTASSSNRRSMACW